MEEIKENLIKLTNSWIDALLDFRNSIKKSEGKEDLIDAIRNYLTTVKDFAKMLSVREVFPDD